MRVIDCDCGQTLQAANDDELAGEVKRHMDAEHSDLGFDDQRVGALVAEQAYDGSDS